MENVVAEAEQAVSLEAWAKLADRYGVSLIALIVLTIFLWRILKWLKPWVEKLFEGHLNFMDRTGTAIEQQTPTLMTHGDKLDAIHQDVKELHPRVERIEQKIDRSK